MRNLGLVCCAVLLLGCCALAQKAEFSGSYAHLTGPVDKDGFNLSAAWLPNRYVGFEADGGGYFGSGAIVGTDNAYTIAGGVRVKLTKKYKLITPWVHLLAGGAREFSNSYFMVMGGGGIDIGNKRVGARLKLDVVNFNDGTHARAALGLVVRP